MPDRPYPPDADEPIAVVGLSCRLPGAGDPEELWRLLRAGADAVAEVPADRWPEAGAPGFRRGGFLAHVDRFDAAFFGVSPNEAAAMDPQHRLALELAWEALERARIAPTSLRGSETAVVIGAINDDYAMLHDRLGAGPHTFTGVLRGLLANRVSYLLGLRGPSLTVDAGQCSSLLAVQLACEQLRRGEVELALAGGGRLMLGPGTTQAIASARAPSPDSACWDLHRPGHRHARRAGGAALLVGSVKTNIGHLEGAAGVAGLAKTALSIVHRELPPSLNFETPNPAIPLDELRLEVVREPRPWPAGGGRLVAGVSSFGIGGTNCHLVLASPPPRRPAERSGPPPARAPWALSARR